MTKTILEQLFDGELYPGEQSVPKSAQYRKLHQQFSAESKYFHEQLSGSDLKHFEAMEELSHELDILESYEDFCCGFRLGIKLMIEALADRNLSSFD